MKVHDIPKSGKRGLVVAFQSRFGQVERQHTPARKPPTAAQLDSAADFGDAAKGWNGLTDEQRDAWRAFGKTVSSHPRGGDSGPLTGQNLYTAINRNQALLGLPRFLYPPERPAFDANPVIALNITEDGDTVSLKLTLAKPPTAPILIFAARPHSAGRQYCDKYHYIGLVPSSDGGQIDFTAQYINKYGTPGPNSRVILRLVQQVNGWRDLPHRIEAVFRPTQPPATPAPRRNSAVVSP
jgi:hypothetical protein